MRILTNVSQAELTSLTSKPTAKEMIQKVKTEGIQIAEGDKQGAAAFLAMRSRQKQEDSLHISDEGRAALKGESEASELPSREDQLKDQIEALKKQLAKLTSQGGFSGLREYRDSKANAIKQQISSLNMQLIQAQKTNSKLNSI